MSTLLDTCSPSQGSLVIGFVSLLDLFTASNLSSYFKILKTAPVLGVFLGFFFNSVTFLKPTSVLGDFTAG